MDIWGNLNEEDNDLDEYRDFGDDNIWDDNDGYMSEEQKDIYQPTFDQLVHSTPINECGYLSISSDSKDKDAYRRELLRLTPVERLKHNINMICYNLNEQKIFEILPEDINKLCRYTNMLDIINIDSKFVNPTAYILGFLATNNGKTQVIKKEVTDIFNKLGLLDDNSIKKEDVVRYTRLWSLKLSDLL